MHTLEASYLTAIIFTCILLLFQQAFATYSDACRQLNDFYQYERSLADKQETKLFEPELWMRRITMLDDTEAGEKAAP